MSPKSYIKVYHTHHCYYDNSCHNRHHFHNCGDGDIFSYMGMYGNGCCHGGFSFGGSFWGGFGVAFGMGIADMLCGFIGGLFNPYPQYNTYNSWNSYGWDSYGLGYGGPGDSFTGSYNNTGNSYSSTYPISAKYAKYSNKKAGTRSEDPAPATVTTETVIQEFVEDPKQKNLNAVYTQLTAEKDRLTIKKYNEYLKTIETTITGKTDITKPNVVPTPVNGDWTQEPFASKLTIKQMEDLKAVGITPVNINGKYALSLPDAINKASITLLASSGMPVALAHNSGDDIEDDWIVGTIDSNSIEEDSDGKLSYEIDCANFSKSMYKFKYSVKQNKKDSDLWTISYLSGYTADNGDLYTKPNATYKFSNKCMETKTDPVISKLNRENYSKITTSS